MRRHSWIEVAVLIGVVCVIALPAGWFSRRIPSDVPLERAASSETSRPPSPAPHTRPRIAWPPSNLLSPRPPSGLSDDQRDAWSRGIVRADDDLRSGYPSLRFYGDVRLSSMIGIHQETGLPARHSGCVEHPEDNAEELAYRSRVQQYIQLRGLPPNSRLKWITQILHPARWLEAHKTSLMRLSPGNRCVSPEGITIEVMGDEGGVSGLRSSTGRDVSETPIMSVDHIDLAWGPPGSRTLFCRAGNTCFAYDQERLWVLRAELVPDPPAVAR